MLPYDGHPHGLPIDLLPVNRLRQIISSSGLSHADCFEMSDLRSRAHSATMILMGRRQALEDASKARSERYGTPESEELVCGMALGYADPDANVNTLRSERANLSDFATFVTS